VKGLELSAFGENKTLFNYATYLLMNYLVDFINLF